MANSLIELYGGGMTRPSSNYQLGGRIASSKRESDYQGEVRRLKEEAERAAKRQRRASGLGSILSTVGSIAGSLIPIPGVGTAVGSAIGTAIGSGLGRLAGESTYKDTKVEGGKYAQQSRKDIQDASDDFRKSMGERALVGAAKAGLMKFASEGGADYLKAKFGPSGLPESVDIPELEKIEGGLGFETPRMRALFDADSIAAQELGAKQALLDRAGAFVDPSPYIPFQDMPLSDISATELGDFSSIGLPLQYPLDAYRSAGGYGPFQNRGGGLINYMIPEMQSGGLIPGQPIFGPGTDWSMTGSNVFGFRGAGAQVSNPDAAPITGRGINVGYGTATDVGGALAQMGMGNIVNDPRFAQYAGDLPQFGMGYAQQVGDIYAGGKQATRGIRGEARTAAGQRGFGRSGIGSQQLESSMTNLYTDIDRQRRGVVEGYQADLLSAIRDIERKGEFEFNRNASAAAPPNAATAANQNPNVALTPAEEQYEQEMQAYYDQQYG
tara:strand:- start:12535 stop:14025 length:1491 start_codon:yes stop_codon:yes gene_type:complete